MNCPMCDTTYTMVTAVDPVEGDKVTRKRKCPECKHVYTTVEVYAEVYARLEFRSANYKTLVSPTARAEAKAMADKVLSRGR